MYYCVSYFIFFPLNILVVYLIIQGYTKNKEDIFGGIIDEIKILWIMLINLKKSKLTEEDKIDNEPNEDFDVLDNNIEPEINTTDKKEE